MGIPSVVIHVLAVTSRALEDYPGALRSIPRLTINQKRNQAVGDLELDRCSIISVLGHIHSARQVRVSRIC